MPSQLSWHSGPAHGPPAQPPYYAHALPSSAPHAVQHAPPPVSSLNIPYVVESTARGERGYDIFSRLLVERIVCVNGAVDDTTSALVVAQLLYLDSLSQEAPIHMYINSPGEPSEPLAPCIALRTRLV